MRGLGQWHRAHGGVGVDESRTVIIVLAYGSQIVGRLLHDGVDTRRREARIFLEHQGGATGGVRTRHGRAAPGVTRVAARLLARVHVDSGRRHIRFQQTGGQRPVVPRRDIVPVDRPPRRGTVHAVVLVAGAADGNHATQRGIGRPGDGVPRRRHASGQAHLHRRIAVGRGVVVVAGGIEEDHAGGADVVGDLSFLTHKDAA